ncbi:MAG: arsenate reductase ArsC [Opitutales bacterium]
MKKKILILCTGNSCRSQMAHAFLQSFDENLIVRSSGTRIAKQVNPLAIKVMTEVGIDISTHKPTLLDNYIGESWDYVITVCGNAKETCPIFSGEVKNRLHLGFEDPSEAVGNEDFIMSEFRRIRDSIKETFYTFYIENIKD